MIWEVLEKDQLYPLRCPAAPFILKWKTVCWRINLYVRCEYYYAECILDQQSHAKYLESMNQGIVIAGSNDVLGTAGDADELGSALAFATQCYEHWCK